MIGWESPQLGLTWNALFPWVITFELNPWNGINRPDNMLSLCTMTSLRVCSRRHTGGTRTHHIKAHSFIQGRRWHSSITDGDSHMKENDVKAEESGHKMRRWLNLASHLFRRGQIDMQRKRDKEWKGDGDGRTTSDVRLQAVDREENCCNRRSKENDV